MKEELWRAWTVAGSLTFCVLENDSSSCLSIRRQETDLSQHADQKTETCIQSSHFSCLVIPKEQRLQYNASYEIKVGHFFMTPPT